VLAGLFASLAAACAQPATPAGMNAESIAEMLRAHNELRSARKIRPLKWSASLAESAQQWAEHLAAIGVMQHNLELRTGQNLYVIHGATTRPALVVRRWAEESRDYREPEKYCRLGAICGHFTQIIWAETEEVGCGVASGERGQFWVCYYLPPGNVVGEKPY
jgi:hypothetical protein